MENQDNGITTVKKRKQKVTHVLFHSSRRRFRLEYIQDGAATVGSPSRSPTAQLCSEQNEGRSQNSSCLFFFVCHLEGYMISHMNLWGTESKSSKSNLGRSRPTCWHSRWIPLQNWLKREGVFVIEPHLRHIGRITGNLLVDRCELPRQAHYPELIMNTHGVLILRWRRQLPHCDSLIWS